jgi:1,4-alpha-glucan branching enzyme
MIGRKIQSTYIAGFAVLLLTLAMGFAFAQERAPQAPQGPVVTSPEVLADGRITFRLLAPKAETVGLQAGDLPGLQRSAPQFVKAENGVWETTVGPIEPGAYRYRFMVNGVAVMDPRNPATATKPGHRSAERDSSSTT